MQGFIDQGIRLPTSADADPEEQVLWSWFDGETDRIIKAHYNQVECGPRWAALNNLITLATLHKASAQQVFTQVKNHLLKQNEKSMLKGDCAYRGDHNLQCAAGCLMTDKEANKFTESRPWLVLVQDGQVPRKHKELIQDLQGIHDGERPEEWPESLLRLAFDEGLNY